MSAALRFLILAAALAFAGAASAQPTISAAPAIRAPATSTLATWGGLSSATGWDSIELHAVGSATVVAWQYTGGAKSGSLWFWIPGSVAHGTYELWLIRSGWGHVATSNPITVSTYLSGTITDGGSPVPGVSVSASNGASCIPSDAAGAYYCAITSGWSGTVTPSKAGYVFTPGSRSYTNVTSTQTGQTFSAAVSHSVSGTATLNGLPLANVAFSASGGWSCTPSDSQGQYSCAVPTGWTGTITPSQTGYSFTPASRNYTSLATDDPGEDYAASLTSPVVPIGFIHVDHLNTPRLITNDQGQAVWRWDQQEPFGVNVADENPSGLGAYEMPLRFPGQYFDKETNLHYNYFRDYDSGIGRYVQSDPIGLRGGLNTYAYVSNSPVASVDPTGLLKWSGSFELSSLGAMKAGGTRGRFSLVSECDIDGNQGHAEVLAHTGSLGVGTPTAKTWGSVDFVDGEIRALEKVFWGGFRVNSIGFQAGPIGFGKTTIFLGEAVSTRVDAKGGFDLGLQIGIAGFSEVTNFRVTKCKCEPGR